MKHTYMEAKKNSWLSASQIHFSIQDTCFVQIKSSATHLIINIADDVN